MATRVFSALAIAAGSLCLSAALAAAPPSPTKPLQIYFVDVEGGQATLFVTPEGQSLLIDTGWPGNDNRDADRIVAAAHDAGISKIDYVLITHFHDDHVGGAPQLAAKIPIGTFIDHGENRETSDPVTQQRWLAYKALLDSGKFKHLVAKPGDVIPIKGLRVEVVTADGHVPAAPLPGAGQPNPACSAPAPPADATENPRSLGSLITFGKLRILDLGDLTADKERLLVCPVNLVGTVDLFIASHHGLFQSNSAPLLAAIQPHVAIVDNGASKGGSLVALDIIRNSANKPDVWQIHYSEEAGAHNSAESFLANLHGPDAGNYLKVTARTDGSFEVFNSRTRESKSYPAKP
ncbi:MAG TPA: MBL fold metallo-hydrolase [Dongiaceae bacterium]|nr:MBL fold metallo-hydrolase [Dongiaceae bacterium]